ncbi:unnamed protein product [Rotaria sp. Silwood1]|nr:unnamed protein product [Rotaria sp. Silwood1]
MFNRYSLIISGIIFLISLANGYPSNDINNKCVNYCSNDALCLIINNNPRCYCLPEFDGERCQMIRTTNRNTRIKFKQITENNPINPLCSYVPDLCHNGGTCDVEESASGPKFICRCPISYDGSRSCYQHCFNNGNCTLDATKNPICTCTESFAPPRCIAFTTTTAGPTTTMTTGSTTTNFISEPSSVVPERTTSPPLSEKTTLSSRPGDTTPSPTQPQTNSPPDKHWLDLQYHDADKQLIKKPNEVEIDTIDYPPWTRNNDIVDRIQGSMFGLAIGDALGAHVEFRPHSYMEANPVKDLQGGGTWGLEKGQFTDDTSMALCLANSLIASQGFNAYDQLVRYKWWYRHGYMSSTGHCFDIGVATRHSIQEFEKRQRKFSEEFNIDIDQLDSYSNPHFLQSFNVNCSEDGVAGNGSLMRLAPVPLFFYKDPEKAIEYSGKSGQITHGDKKAIDACRYYGALIVATLNGKKKDELISDTFFNNYKKWFGNEDLHPDILSIAQGSYKKNGGYEQGIRGKGYVVNSLEAALWAFWSDGDSFEQGVLNAVNLGDDTDTTAAIYGQLAGAYYGYEQLPKNWCDFIYAKKFLVCVSNWIAYEGEKWFKNQKMPYTIESLINSSSMNLNKTSISSINLNKESCLNHDNQSNNNVSLTHNQMDSIERKAIDSSGRIGSLYDACRDCIVESPHIDFHFNENKAHSQTKCVVETGDKIEFQNLLQLIGFNNEFQLSLLLNTVLPMGIALVIEYPYLIDEYTRIFYYSYTIRQECLSMDVDNLQKSIQQSTSKDIATHIITAIDVGIDVVVILRLIPDNQKVIDNTLNKIRECLISNTILPDEVSFDGILSTHIYSNIPDLNNKTKLLDIYHDICKFKNNSNSCRPSTYILKHIEEFHSDKDKICSRFTPIEPKIVQNIEQNLIRLLWLKKIWKATLDNQTSNILNKYLKEQLQAAENQSSKLIDRYENEKIKLQKMIVNLRCSKDTQNVIEHNLFNEDIQTTLKDSIDDSILSLTRLKEKVAFIINLQQRNIEYQNAIEFSIEQSDNDNIIEDKLLKNNYQQRIICSNDQLNKNNYHKLDELFSTMLNERKSKPYLNIVYVDFTYSMFELNEIKIIPSINNTENINERISLLTNKKDISDQPSISSTDDQTINILLLGKSGVGKSTLINTYINYLKFNNYEDIILHRSPLYVIIKCADLIKNAFEEHVVHLTNDDSNENYDYHDQSITQNCKSYYFNIDNNNNKKLCFIDTPGFSKNDYKKQDELVMQQILSSIINLTHLNAICILLEPNDKQLDVYRTCLTYLFNFLEFDAMKNLIFCFTKTLSHTINSNELSQTVKTILKSIPVNNIPFKDTNIFTFDSTFFRHLTIERHLTISDNHQNDICKQSWLISHNGWNHLLDYVSNNLQPYFLDKGLKKREYIKLEINQLIRPIVETIRNNMRNILLWNIGHTDYSIELHPISVKHSSTLCYSCKYNYQQCGIFWIIYHYSHNYTNKCHTCSCDSNNHMHIDYQLEYKYQFNQINNRCIKKLTSSNELLQISINLVHFLMYVMHMTDNDPFLFNLNRIINEENFICNNISSHHFNLLLYNQLRLLKQDYEKQMNNIIEKRVQNESSVIENINDSIAYLKQIPMIKIQLDAARKIQETFL